MKIDSIRSLIFNRRHTMGYNVILVNQLSMYGTVGEFHHHVFRDKEHFEEWFNEEEREKAFLYKENIKTSDAFSLFAQSPTP